MNNLKYALEYACQGFSVFPVHYPKEKSETGNWICSCGHSDCKQTGKHPATKHGHKDATRDETAIQFWWSKENYNIGIATGDVSGLIVVDFDKDFEKDELYLSLPTDTLIAQTGGGGFHYYFRCPPGDVRNSQKKISPCADVRANGGYIVAPPSRHRNGKNYEWVNENLVQPLPDPILARIVAAKEKPKQKASKTGKNIPDGQRNGTLFKVACGMRGDGFEENEIFTRLIQENDRCQPPLDTAELQKIAHSVMRYPPSIDPCILKGTMLGLPILSI